MSPLRYCVLPALLLAIASCRDSAGPSVSLVAINPRVASIQVGDSVRLTAVVKDAGGAVLSGVAVAWSSSDTLRVSVSPTGLVRAHAPGSATIAARANGHSDTLSVAVSAAFLVVSQSQDHACALATDGAAWCWGAGYFGELGNGSTDDKATPTLVAGGHAFRSIAAMAGSTCALATDSTAYCWGLGAYGELGTGDTLNRLTPIAVAGGLHFREIVGTCGLTATGSAYCWGENFNGQAGPGLDDILSPAPVAGGLTFVHLAASGLHTCGVTASGAAYCWGDNAGLELGAATDTPQYVPTPVAGGGAYRSVAAGFPACGIAADSTVHCWGTPGFGGFRTPTPLTGGLHFSEIGTSPPSFSVCGVTAAGAAYCWGGGNLTAQDQTLPISLDPVPVPGAHAFTQVSAAPSHRCGVATDSTAWCWGDNHQGQLGDGMAEDSAPAPVPVSGNLKFLTVQTGKFRSCGLTVSGDVYCWGSSTIPPGHAGPTQPDYVTPTLVGGGVTFRSLTVGGTASACGLATDSTAWCWPGDAPYTATPAPVGLKYQSLSAGDGYYCGVAAGGTAYCWGWNNMGSLGIPGPDRSYSATPMAVTGGITFASISAGAWSTCGVATSGTLYCWGSNIGASLGLGTVSGESRVPLPVLGGHAFTTLDAGLYHTCALTADGGAWCWGSGQQHDATDIGATAASVTPVRVPGSQQFASLTLGPNISCGLTGNGAAYCWGRGNPAPTAVQDTLRFISLSANAYGTTCGVTVGHALVCWGQGTTPAPRRRALRPIGRGPRFSPEAIRRSRQ